jgi:hypothetical protein
VIGANVKGLIYWWARQRKKCAKKAGAAAKGGPCGKFVFPTQARWWPDSTMRWRRAEGSQLLEGQLENFKVVDSPQFLVHVLMKLAIPTFLRMSL